MAMDQHIGWAVHKMRNGYRVQRAGWNGKGMYLELMAPSPHNHTSTAPCTCCMKTADDQRVPWLYSCRPTCSPLIGRSSDDLRMVVSLLVSRRRCP